MTWAKMDLKEHRDGFQPINSPECRNAVASVRLEIGFRKISCHALSPGHVIYSTWPTFKSLPKNELL
jgi:hypothetical protein